MALMLGRSVPGYGQMSLEIDYPVLGRVDGYVTRAAAMC